MPKLNMPRGKPNRNGTQIVYAILEDFVPKFMIHIRNISITIKTINGKVLELNIVYIKDPKIEGWPKYD